MKQSRATAAAMTTLFTLFTSTNALAATNCYSNYGAVGGAIGIPSGDQLYSLTETTMADIYQYSAFWNKGVFSWIANGTYTHFQQPPSSYACGMYCMGTSPVRIGWRLAKGVGTAWYEVNTSGHPWLPGAECRWGFDNGVMLPQYVFDPIWMLEKQGPYFGQLLYIAP